MGQTQQAVEQCEMVLNQLRRADKDLPLLKIAREQHNEIEAQAKAEAKAKGKKSNT